MVARSGDDGIDSLKPTEIPPPRSKKKCIHPYPRKGNFFSVSGSHVLLSSDLNSSRTTSSKQLKLIKNRHASSIASIEEMNIENATSSGQDKSKSFIDLNFAAEENSCSPQGTMKLFGQTILVSNSKTVDLKGRPTAIMDVKETREERSQTGFTSVGCFENVNENCRVVGVQTAQPPENEPGFALLGEIVSRRSRAKCVNMIDNGYLPSVSTIVEVNRFSSPELCVCRKPLQDVNLPLKNSNCSPKGAPVKTLRLFGKTILVTDSQTGVLNGGPSTQVMKTQKEWSRMGSASYMHSINENESHCVGHVQRAQPHENE
ncbi:hypothetical protein QJS04_geneDACA009834 [Acorus gramineus]|uniref:Uncharacterized protein n=1 Tax=Acorus gramineus TaxID=55184 RepID=A0AAV9B961_ACOGR|nr:hypothetical protein QJS04_geneDACA009834 [Acorus gramineus]